MSSCSARQDRIALALPAARTRPRDAWFARRGRRRIAPRGRNHARGHVSQVQASVILAGIAGSPPSKGNTAMEHSLVALLVVLAATAATARADDKKAADHGPPPKAKVYDFSGDTIEGDLIRPEGSVVNVPGIAKDPSLIRLRKDFIPELVKAAEDL
jgi:hypothetical protein